MKVWVPWYGFSHAMGPASIGYFNGYEQFHAGGPQGVPPGLLVIGAVGTPNLFRTNGVGFWTFTQLVKFYNVGYAFIPSPWSDHESGTNFQYWLDAEFAYPSTVWSANAVDPGDPVTEWHEAEDSPGVEIRPDIKSYSVGYDFLMYLMYHPPDAGEGTKWVSLHILNWWWNSEIQRASPIAPWLPNPPQGPAAGISMSNWWHPTWNSVYN